MGPVLAGAAGVARLRAQLSHKALAWAPLQQTRAHAVITGRRSLVSCAVFLRPLQPASSLP